MLADNLSANFVKSQYDKAYRLMRKERKQALIELHHDVLSPKSKLGFCAHFSDKSNVTGSPLTRKGVTVNQLQLNNQLMPMDF